MHENKGEIIIYKDKEGSKIDVKLEAETIWLTQAQIAVVFDIDRTVVTKHISNIFNEGELNKISSVQKMHIPKSDRPVNYYDLDTIISVGYRVNSRKATQFRIWATKTLKDHIVKGYTINEKRLAENKERLAQLEQSVDLVKRAIDSKSLRLDEAQGLLNIITEYTRSWVLLNKFDHDELDLENLSTPREKLDYQESKDLIQNLRNEIKAGDIFGNEISYGLQRILGAINQTFDNQELYPTIEEKAAHLLYLIIKDHPFSDGNKRIGSLLFLIFLERNKFLDKQDGRRKINDNALVAVALLVAISNPKDKEIMVALIINLIKEY